MRMSIQLCSQFLISLFFQVRQVIISLKKFRIFMISITLINRNCPLCYLPFTQSCNSKRLMNPNPTNPTHPLPPPHHYPHPSLHSSP
ncbi:hypothetical protein DFJ43DRAFT_1046899 [Lentinula guzmanii]|uniref:Uncharacterized protein n=1 Tax=Lentinula guzmanii TaxID=2804957 RepID=A0AA38JTY8_9AGAR|nr:hypothetical protein DFJ43DRAFT_1046899 [Lentinula guzmanii]